MKSLGIFTCLGCLLACSPLATLPSARVAENLPSSENKITPRTKGSTLEITPRTKGSTLGITPRTKGSTLLKGRVVLPFTGPNQFNIMIENPQFTQFVQTNDQGFFGVAHLPPERYVLRAQALENPHLILTALVDVNENRTTQEQEISVRSTAVQKLMSHAQKMDSTLQELSVEKLETMLQEAPDLKSLETTLSSYLGQKMTQPVESMGDVKDQLEKARKALESMPAQ